jgi:hypothetical protein
MIHDQSTCAPVSRAIVDVRRPSGAAITLGYHLACESVGLRVPPVAKSRRRDELWKHTCFEFFLRVGEGYYEFNFAPSSEWAAYRFSGYRAGMAPLAVAPPQIEVQTSAKSFALSATVDLGALAPERPWRMGLSAVVEETNGNKSYWALRHPPGSPDFHHRDCFTGELA